MFLIFASVQWRSISFTAEFPRLSSERIRSSVLELLLPDGASLARTAEVTRQIEAAVQKIAGVRSINTIGGSGGPNAALMIIALDDWDDRRTPELSMNSILGQIRRNVARVEGGVMFAYQVPPIRGLGQTAGLEMQLEDLASGDPRTLAESMRALVVTINQDPRVRNMFSTYQ
jgi:HAE1 family hydrophobic/amphiphilic exporter-1